MKLKYEKFESWKYEYSRSYEEQIAKLYSAVNEQNEIIKKLGMFVFRRQGIALDLAHTK